MALGKRSIRAKGLDNTGLSGNAGEKTARFLNKKGEANVIRRGVPFYDRFSIYHYLLKIPTARFIVFVFGFYTTINFLFAGVYYLFCLPHLIGLERGSAAQNFEEAFFFSSQTLTTVGYGRISPSGLLTNTIASFEALIGIMTLAIITGLLYGRFVKPKAFIKFSSRAVIAPFKEAQALMFRLAPIKNTTLTDVVVNVTVSLLLEENGKKKYQYFQLPLQFDKVNNLFMNWTVVHPITEESPFHNLTAADLDEADAEVMVYLKGFDENYSNNVVARTSYTYDEIVFGAKFVPMFHESVNGTIVEINKLNDYLPVQGNDR